MRFPLSSAIFCAVLVTACDKSSAPPDSPSPAEPEPVAAPPEEKNDAVPEPKQSEEPAPSTDPATPDGLAHVLIKDGTVAWIASSKSAVAVENWNEEGTGIGMQAVIVDDKGKKDTIDLCQPADCDKYEGKQGLATLTKKLAEELRKRSVAGAVAMKEAKWPTDKKELELTELESKLVWTGNHLQVVRKGKPGKALPPIKAAPPHKPAPSAVFLSSDGSVLVLRVNMDPGDKYNQGYNVHSQLHVYRMP